MTGEELYRLRKDLGDAIGRRLSLADMAKLCGLQDPERNGKDTIRKWEAGEGPSGPVAALLSILAYASERYDISEDIFEAGELGGEYVEFLEERFRKMIGAKIRRRLS